MAAFEDAFGRLVEGIDSLNTTTSQVKDMLRTLMTGNVGKASKVGGGTAVKDLVPSLASIQKTLDNWQSTSREDSAKLERIAKATETINSLVSQIKPNFDKDVGEAKKYADTAVAVHKMPSPPSKKGSFGPEGVKLPLIKGIEIPGLSKNIDDLLKKEDKLVDQTEHLKDLGKDTTKIRDHIKDIAKEALTKGSLFVSDQASQLLLGQILVAIQGGVASPAAAAAAVSAATVAPTPTPTPPAGGKPKGPDLSLQGILLHVSDRKTHVLLALVLQAIKKTTTPAAGPAAAGPAAAGPAAAGPAAAGGIDKTALEELKKEHGEALTIMKAEMAELKKMNAGVKETTDSIEKQNIRWKASLWAIRQINSFLEQTQRSIMGVDDKARSLMGHLLGGIAEQPKFIKDVRAVAYQTAGVTRESGKLQEVYEDIGKTAERTGVDVLDFQSSYIANLKNGIRLEGQEYKGQKLVLKVTEAQLYAEKQLGLKAGELTSEFQEWVLIGKMNVGEVSEMARGMRDVARNSGLTGEALKSAVKNGQQFVKQLADAGQLTTSAAKNIIGLSAAAQKLGVTEPVNRMLKSLTSTNELLNDTNNSWMFIAANNAGVMDKLMNNTLTSSRKGMKEFAKGSRDIIKNLGAGTQEEFAALSPDAQRNINLVIKSITGMEAGAFYRVVEAQEEAAKGLGDQLKGVEAERNKILMLEKKGLNMDAEKAALDEKERGMRASGALSVFQALDKATKGTESMDEALAKFGKDSEKLEDLKDMGKTWGSNAEAAKAAIEESLKTINAGLAKQGQAEINISSGDIEAALKDKTKFKELGDTLIAAERKMATKQGDKLDPISEVLGILRNWNDTIVNGHRKTLTSLLGIGGKFGVIAALLTTLVGQAILGQIIWSRAFGSGGIWSKVWAKLTGKGAAALVPGAAAGISAGRGVTAGAAGVTKGATAAPKAAGKITVWFEKFGYAITRFGDHLSQGVRIISGNAMNLAIGTEQAGKEFGKAGRRLMQIWKMQFDLVLKPLRSFGTFISESFSGIWTSAKGIWSKGLVSSIGNFFVNVKSAFFEGIKGLWGGLKGIGRGATEILPQLISLSTKGLVGVGKGAAFAGKGAGKLALRILGFGRTIPVWGQILSAALIGVDAVIGVFDGAAEAAEIYGKKQEDLTLSQEYSAKGAGMLISILNGVSFGLLGLFVDLKAWRAALAKFLDKFKALNAVVSILTVAIEIVWGVIKGVALGLWEIAKGLWDGIVAIVMPLVEGISDIIMAIWKIFAPAEKAGEGVGWFAQTLRDLGGVVGIVSGFFKGLGAVIGWVLRAIGNTLGFIIKVVAKFIEGFVVVFEPFGDLFSLVWESISEAWGLLLQMLGPVIKGFQLLGQGFSWLFSLMKSGDEEASGLGKALKVVFAVVKFLGQGFGTLAGMLIKLVLAPLMLIGKVFVAVIKFISDVLDGFADIFTGNFKEGFSKLGGAVISLLGNLLGAIVTAILWPFEGLWKWLTGSTESMAQKVIGWFTWLKDKLIGHSIIPDIILGIIDWFLFLPRVIFKILGPLVSFVGGLFREIYNTVSGVLTSIGDTIMQVWEEIEPVITSIWQELQPVFKQIGDAFATIWATIQPIFAQLWAVIWPVIKAIGKFIGTIGLLVVFGPIIAAVGLLIGALWVVAKVLPIVVGVIGWLIRKAIWPFVTALKLVGAVWKIVSSLFSGDIGKKFSQFGTLLWDNTIGKMKEWGAWLWNNTIGKMKEWGTWLWNETIKKMDEWGTWLYNNTIQPFKDFGNYIYNMFKTALERVVDWVISTVPGAKAYFDNRKSVAENAAVGKAQTEQTKVLQDAALKKGKEQLDKADTPEAKATEKANLERQIKTLDERIAGLNKTTELVQSEKPAWYNPIGQVGAKLGVYDTSDQIIADNQIKAKELEESKKALEELLKAATKEKSIYTHDVHLEELLEAVSAKEEDTLKSVFDPDAWGLSGLANMLPKMDDLTNMLPTLPDTEALGLGGLGGITNMLPSLMDALPNMDITGLTPSIPMIKAPIEGIGNAVNQGFDSIIKGEGLPSLISAFDRFTTPLLREEQLATPPQPQTAVPQSPVDLHEEMQKRYATDKTAVATQLLPLAALDEISEQTEETVEVSGKMLDALLKIVDALKPSSVVGGAVAPAYESGMPVPASPPRYYPLTSGLFVQASSTGVIPGG